MDGFRVDAVPYMYEDEALRDNPVVNGVIGNIYTENLNETYAITLKFGEILNNYSKVDGKQR